MKEEIGNEGGLIYEGMEWTRMDNWKGLNRYGMEWNEWIS